MRNILAIATEQIGTKEINGPAHNPTIVNYAQEAGFEWINDDETAWCSIFMNWCAQKAGLEHSKKANARSWLQTGTMIENPEPGDVVVYWRTSISSWQGHVGLFLGYHQSGDAIYTLGGNQDNSVSIKPYSTNQLLGFRKLSTENRLIVPLPLLRYNSSGERVIQLQETLKLAGFRAGLTDGFYGDKTREAIKALQTREGLSIDGIYGQQTAKRLNEVVQRLKLS